MRVYYIIHTYIPCLGPTDVVQSQTSKALPQCQYIGETVQTVEMVQQVVLQHACESWSQALCQGSAYNDDQKAMHTA